MPQEGQITIFLYITAFELRNQYKSNKNANRYMIFPKTTPITQKLTRLLLSLLFVFVTNYLSAQYLIYPDSIPVHTVRVPLPYLQGGTVQDYITDIEYFPLEAKEKADMINSVSDISINSDRIIVYSNSFTKNPPTSFLYVYDTKGNLKFRLSTRDDFQSSLLNEIKPWGRGFLARSMHHAIELDTAGHWNKTTNPFSDIGDSLYMDNATWYYQSFRERDAGAPKIGLYRDTIPYIRYSSGTKPTLFHDLDKPFSPYFKQVDAAYNTFSFSTEVFELTDRDIRQVYKFILPIDYTLDTAEYRLVKNEDEMKSFSSRYPNAVVGFDNVIRYKTYLLLQLKYINGKSQWIALNVETNDFIDLQSLLPDSSSEYTAVTGSQEFLNTDGEYLYSMIYPDQFVDRWGEIENKRPITEKARSLSKSKNPVLVRFKLK